MTICPNVSVSSKVQQTETAIKSATTESASDVKQRSTARPTPVTRTMSVYYTRSHSTSQVANDSKQCHTPTQQLNQAQLHSTQPLLDYTFMMLVYRNN